MSTIRATNFQHASAAAPAIVLAADGTAAATVSGINGGPLAGFRNAIINGNFDVWQRGTSFSNPTSGAYLADRWLHGFDGNGSTRTVSRQSFTLGQTDVPGEPTYFFRYAQSVAGTGGASSNFQQRIEGVRTFAGQQVTVSFYAKAAASTTLPSITLGQFFGTGGSPSATVTTTLVSSLVIGTGWTRYTYTATLPSISGKTLGSTEDDRLSLVFNLPLNSTFTLDFAQVQVEAGPVATPFERRPAGTELTLCERYYEIGNYLSNYYFNNSWAPATKNEHVTFRTTKRAVPVIGGTFTGGGWTGTWSTGGATNNGFWFGNNATINAGTFGHSATWTASAEL